MGQLSKSFGGKYVRSNASKFKCLNNITERRLALPFVHHSLFHSSTLKKKALDFFAAILREYADES